MKTIKHLRITLLALGFVLPMSSIANPSYGSFPVQQYARPVGQFPPMMQATPAPYRSARPAYPAQNYSAYPYSGMQRPSYGYPYQRYQQPYRQMNYRTPNYQFSNMTPFGNSFSPSSLFNNNNFPSPWSNSNMWNPWQNGNNSSMPFFPQQNTNKKKAWGDVRNIWPDFYTDMTEEMWDQGTNGPYDMGRMPGGWRAPSLSSPDPVTVGDAVLNQFPPMMEEMGNMMDFSN